MKKLFFVLCLTLLLTSSSWASDLKVLSGAGLMKPMQELKNNFEKQNNVKLQVHYGSSGELFGLLATGQDCDVLIPGAAKYTMDALKNGWVIEKSIHKLVEHIPTIAVPAGNPAKIKGLQDLANNGVRVAIGDPKAPAIGRVALKILKKQKLYPEVKPNIKVYAPTVNQLLIYVAMNQVDAAIIWKDMTSWAEGRGKIAVVDIAPAKNIIKTIPTAVCSRTKNKDLAWKFNNYLASKEGLAIWKKWGFEPCAK